MTIHLFLLSLPFNEGRDIVMHPRNGPKVWYPYIHMESTIEPFLTEWKDLL